MLHRRAKARFRQHIGVFRERVGIAFRSCCEHDQTETRDAWRRGAVFIWHELDDGRLAAGPKRSVSASEEANTIRGIEVVEEVWHEHDVVITAEFHVEGAAGNRAEALLDSGRAGVFASDFEHRGPIQGDDLRAWKFFCERQSPRTVAGGDVEHLGWADWIERDQFGESSGRGR